MSLARQFITAIDAVEDGELRSDIFDHYNDANLLRIRTISKPTESTVRVALFLFKDGTALHVSVSVSEEKITYRLLDEEEDRPEIVSLLFSCLSDEAKLKILKSAKDHIRKCGESNESS